MEDRQTDRQTERNTERQKETKTETERDTDSETDTETEAKTETETDSDGDKSKSYDDSLICLQINNALFTFCYFLVKIVDIAAIRVKRMSMFWKGKKRE